MKNNQHEQLTELTAEFEGTPAFHELDDEVAATCSGGTIYFGGSNPDVILFEDTQYRGKALRINATSGDGDDNLDNAAIGSGWNNRTSSIRVIRGTWQIYTDGNYKGTTRTLVPGDYYTPQKFGLPNDSLTGIRRVG
jgi:hypothetical protein